MSGIISGSGIASTAAEGFASAIPVPKRLYPLRPLPVTTAMARSKARFIIVPAGRRSGKTERAKRRLVRAVYDSIMEERWDDPRFFAGAPTRDQAKGIYWSDLKKMFPPQMFLKPPRETDLILQFKWGAELHVVGMDKPQRIEGRSWDGGVLDEFANMKPGAWGENVRPALSDRKGWCWLIGVPEGRNHYYELYQYALTAGDPEWAAFTWKSIQVLDAAEVESARRQLDPLVFMQEYEASFVNFEGRAYYTFATETHAVKKLKYNPRADLSFCFDFNVDPGVCAIVQEQRIPGQYWRDRNGLPLLNSPVEGTGVIGEVHIERNSNTPAVCRKLVQDWGHHQGNVFLYGDATGGSRHSSQTQGSDWDLIRTGLVPTFGERLFKRVRSSNPSERARLNAMNTRLKTGDGVVRMMVDPKCKHMIKDLEGVRLLKGGSGEIDKKIDPKLTHISDALGYYVEREFPTTDRSLHQREAQA